eukprot:TRINITY_DN3697_c0_g1_i1.p1 TRINITY_DN3697_c0_g1~~TRINITY_DN3697_c0_g1_i1.p1  ORF type:complete len:203 (-),score=31.78 TRINITY_DN3697_c0_g1_i1:31-564(-)
MPQTGPKKRRTIPLPTDYSNVLDFTNLEGNLEANKEIIQKVTLEKPFESKHFNNVTHYYSISTLPGLFFIPNPFTNNQQKHWIQTCIKEYPIGNPNNITNLEGNKKLFDTWTAEIMPNLRWSSLGYHFQWTPRTYEEEKQSEFPSEMQELVGGNILEIPLISFFLLLFIHFSPSSSF